MSRRIPIPQCPNGCGPIYRSHTCPVSALDKAPTPREFRFHDRLVAVPADPELVQAPPDWRARVDAEMHGWQERRARRAAGHLVAVDDLDWSDDCSGEQLGGLL